MRTSATMTISLPAAMARQMEKVRKEENRTRSELLREAWRLYFESRYGVEAPTRAELTAIRNGRAAYKRGEYVTLAQLHDELDAGRNKTRPKRSRKTS